MQYGSGSPEARWRTQGRDVFLGIVSSSWEPSKPMRVVILSVINLLDNEDIDRYYWYFEMMSPKLKATMFSIIVY